MTFYQSVKHAVDDYFAKTGFEKDRQDWRLFSKTIIIPILTAVSIYVALMFTPINDWLALLLSMVRVLYLPPSVFA